MLFPLPVVNTISVAVINGIKCLQYDLANQKSLRNEYGEILDIWLSNGSHSKVAVRKTFEYERYSAHTKNIRWIKNYLRDLHKINIYIKQIKHLHNVVSEYSLNSETNLSLIFTERELRLIVRLLHETNDLSYMYSYLGGLKNTWAIRRAMYELNNTSLENQIRFLQWKISRNQYNKQLSAIRKIECAIKHVKLALKEKSSHKPEVSRSLSFKSKLNKLYWNIKRGTY